MTEEKDNRPTVLWTCDVPGWAYYNRIMRISKVLTGYRHIIWYFGNRFPRHVQQKIVSEADIIICQGVKSLRLVQLKSLDFSKGDTPEVVLAERFNNVIARLDSVRIDINGEYYDIWTGQALPA
ncbi:unnamed protein product [marine sediment metagenome]|uniref:Uncharacterized protein n=1 Tax=marine sediment metagenome TaxID=412755 RepID=X0VP20_9ZZZZ